MEEIVSMKRHGWWQSELIFDLGPWKRRWLLYTYNARNWSTPYVVLQKTQMQIFDWGGGVIRGGLHRLVSKSHHTSGPLLPFPMTEEGVWPIQTDLIDLWWESCCTSEELAERCLDNLFCWTVTWNLSTGYPLVARRRMIQNPEALTNLKDCLIELVGPDRSQIPPTLQQRFRPIPNDSGHSRSTERKYLSFC